MDFLTQKLADVYKWKSLQPIPKIELPESPIPLVSTNTKIGVEVEVENIRGPIRYDSGFWVIKEDGSLRNHGYEFMSYPIEGNEIAYAINNLFNALPDAADFSERTSIHVHVNVRNFTVQRLLNVVLLYLVFEKTLYRFAGPYRYKNIFCVPIQETRIPVTIQNYLIRFRLNEFIHEWNKYSGLNLLPVKQFGTIEYRMMYGHREQDYLLRWINILLAIHTTAKEYQFMELFNMIQQLNSNSLYGDFLQLVFKEQSACLMGPNLKDEMETGVATVKLISLPSSFHKMLIEKLSNDSDLLRTLGITTELTTKEGMKIPEPGIYDAYIQQAVNGNNQMRVGQYIINQPARWVDQIIVDDPQ